MRMRLVCASILLCAATVSASTGRAVDVSTRARGANRVVIAVVDDVQARFDVNEFGDRLIISRAALRVEETLKGAQAQLIQMDFEGGTIGDLTLKVSDMPALHRGDRGVFMLQATSSGVDRPHDRGLGILKLDGSGRAEGLTLAEIRASVRSALR